MNNNTFDFDKFGLGEILVSCPTETSATNFLNALGERGWLWTSGDGLYSTRWYNLRKDTVYYTEYQNNKKYVRATSLYNAKTIYDDHELVNWKDYMEDNS